MNANLLESVGCRHLFEDILAVVRGENVDLERTTKVLTETIEIFAPIVRGAAIAKSFETCVGMARARDYSAYEFASKILTPHLGEDFANVVQAAEAELRALLNDPTQRPAPGSAVERVAKSYLARMKLERVLGDPGIC